MKKALKIALYLMGIISLMFTKITTVYALEDGAYTVGVTTSYANPETGLIVDGGTNEALGNNMATSMMSPTALVEVTGDRTFVTIGLGLASNVSHPRILIQNSAGVDSYTSVGFTQTGTSFMHDDTVLHLRFEMADPSVLISPIIFVDAMGRDVQFFVRLNMASATSGTGVFLSEMVFIEPELPEPINEEVEITEEVEDVGLEETAEEVLESDEVPERERRSITNEAISLEGVMGLTIYEATSIPEESESSQLGLIMTIAFSVLGSIGGGTYIAIKKKGGR